ncbi:PPOX class F420-dependent oxidoreductase [Actinocorallia longicatena]|uniref:TIGR03618 family F420-dependent PPOX class oxidoreductase n=1 Tax=Actinocorallia longicatena TaxID=111803 RepID=A0ABP6Q9X3_9ACTN
MGEELLAFWRERHLCTITTIRADGTPHVVPVGVTLDAEAGIARVICDGGSQKAKHARRPGAYVAVCQVDGARWSTLEGPATVRDDPGSVAEAVRRYTERYREPRVNPNRVVIEIKVDRLLGTVR